MDRSFLLFINFFCCCFRLPHTSAFSRTSASRTSRVNLQPRPESFPKVGGFPSSPLHRLAALAQQLQPSSFSETDTDQLRRSSHGASESASYQDSREAKGQRPPQNEGIGSERRPKSFALVGPSKSGFTIAVCHSPLPLKLFTHNVIVTAASIDQARLLVLVLAGTIGHLSSLTSEPCLLQRGFLNICRAHDERPQIPAFAARPIALS